MTATRVRARLGAIELAELLGQPAPTSEQIAVIEAPLAPLLVVAGAGSGKTETMAARVVYLVANGLVAPEQVLGLTFTRRAAAELSTRVRTALLRAGVVADAGVDESGEQLIMTYDAFAARLVAEHGLRLGFEADPTMLTGATRYHTAARRPGFVCPTKLDGSAHPPAVGSILPGLHRPSGLNAVRNRTM